MGTEIICSQFVSLPWCVPFALGITLSFNISMNVSKYVPTTYYPQRANRVEQYLFETGLYLKPTYRTRYNKGRPDFHIKIHEKCVLACLLTGAATNRERLLLAQAWYLNE